MSQIRSMGKYSARKTLEQLVGWPAARIVERGEYGDCIIIAHAVGCDCGRCPVLHDDGSVR